MKERKTNIDFDMLNYTKIISSETVQYM